MNNIKYFTDEEEYPRDMFEAEILPFGTAYIYTTDSLVNAFIHLGLPIYGALLNNYHDWDEVAEDNISKLDNFNAIISFTHKNPYLLQNITYKLRDDVVVLNKISDSNVFYFFWLGRGGRHYMGRFKTNDSNETVIEEIKIWLSKNEYGQNYKEIPVNRLKILTV